MELLETQDPERKKLIETSDRHRHELEKEISSIQKRTERILTNALIIGGSLALTYIVISQLVKSGKKKKKANSSLGAAEPQRETESTSSGPSLISQIGTKVVNQATLILLDIAKDKLLEYLESRKKPNENS
jgi:hypothetical protein